MDFHQMNIFWRLKRYNIIGKQNICYVLRWNLIRRMMKQGTEFLWKLLLVQHLHAIFTWKQNITRVRFCEIKSQKKIFQVHVMSSDTTSGHWSSKKYSPSVRDSFSIFFPRYISWEQHLRTAEVIKVLKVVVTPATKWYT